MIAHCTICFEAQSIDDGDRFLDELAERGLIDRKEYESLTWSLTGDEIDVDARRIDEVLNMPAEIGLGRRVTAWLAEGGPNSNRAEGGPNSNRRVTGDGPWIPD